MACRLSHFACVIALVGGCQAKATHSARRAPAPIPEEPQYEAVVASALVFDPPVIRDDAPLELARADREPRVAVGYEEGVVEFFSIRMDDRQIGGGGFDGRFGSRGSGGSFDRYERRAVTERVGVRYR